MAKKRVGVRRRPGASGGNTIQTDVHYTTARQLSEEEGWTYAKIAALTIFNCTRQAVGKLLNGGLPSLLAVDDDDDENDGAATSPAIRRRRKLTRTVARQTKTVFRRTKKLTPTGKASRAKQQKFVVVKHPSAAAIGVQMDNKWNIKVSPSTTRRDLEAIGMVSRVRPKAPTFFEGDEAERLAFAKKQLRLPKRNTNGIMFADECNVKGEQQGPSVRRQWVDAGAAPEPLPRSNGTENQVTVFGVIGLNYRNIRVFKGKRNSATFIKMLDEMNIPCDAASLQASTGNDASLYLDGATYHWSKEVREWAAAQGLVVRDKPPARMSEANPIENMWALCKAEVWKNLPCDAGEVADAMIKVFNEIPVDTVNNLVLSYRNRLTAITEADGARVTTY